MVDVEHAGDAIARVAPFRMNRDTAAAKLRDYLRGRFWAPGAVKQLSVDKKRLRGVLVPHWAFSGVVRSDYSARVGVYWYRTETYTDSDGKTRTRQVRETEWFPLSGTAARQVEDHLVSASLGLSEAESNALEPFDLGWATSYDPRLLSGYEAELPSIDSGRAARTAATELRDLEAERLQRELLPGDTNQLQSIQSKVEVESHDSVLLPVWIGTFQYEEQVLRLLVNGQSGHCAGRVPVSRVKVAIAVAVGVVLVLLLLLWATA